MLVVLALPIAAVALGMLHRDRGYRRDKDRRRGRAGTVGDTRNVGNLDDVGCAGEDSRGDRVDGVGGGAAGQTRRAILLEACATVGLFVVNGLRLFGPFRLDQEPPDEVGHNGNHDETANDAADDGANVGTIATAAIAAARAAVRLLDLSANTPGALPAVSGDSICALFVRSAIGALCLLFWAVFAAVVTRYERHGCGMWSASLT